MTVIDRAEAVPDVRIWPAFLNLYAALCLTLGRIAFRIWTPVAWTAGAIRLGWREARAADQAKRLTARQVR